MGLFAVGLFAALVVAAPARSDSLDEDVGLWAIASARWALSEYLFAGLDVQLRFADDVSQLERVVLRPSAGLRLAEWVGAVLGYDAHVIEYPADRLEQRVWQQLDLDADASRFRLGGRTRLEERLIETVDGVALRLRQRLRVTTPLAANWYAAVSDEVFLNLNRPEHDQGPRTGFDENRFFVGVGRPLAGGFATEVGYQLRFVSRPHGAPDLLAHQILLTLSFRGG